MSSETVQLANSNEELNENGKNASDTVEITSARMGNVENVENDHTYFVSSPSRLKRKVDNLLDTVEDLNKRLKTSHVKVHRLKRKVQSLALVVSELRKKKPDK